jgi:uncharacterized MAPEG superfamily protein
MNSTLTALLGFAGWFVLLSLVMAVYRTILVNQGRPANSFSPNGVELPPFGQRLTRARDNCFETLPLFGAIAIAVSSTGRFDVTDPLAMWLLVARVAQSTVHLVSTSVPAVLVRAGLFFAQMFVYAYWIWRLLTV